MSDAAADPAPKKGVDLGALAHAIAGVCALVLGGLMYSRPWARELFALLMIVGGCQRGVFLLEAFGMGYGALAGNGASLWCHARLYRLAVGVSPLPTLRFGSRLPILSFGGYSQRAQLGQGPTVDGRLPLLR